MKPQLFWHRPEPEKFQRFRAEERELINALGQRGTPGAAKAAAPYHGHPHTSIAPKKVPIVKGSMILKTKDAPIAATAHQYPK